MPETLQMNVIIIGSGNVATVFGKLIKNSGHYIAAVAGRNEQQALQLAHLLEASYYSDLSLTPEADIYIIAVSDSSINDIADKLKVGKKIVVHTSGSVSKNVLQNSSENFGILYPLQSLRKENENSPVIPLLIDANNNETLRVLKSFASTLTSKISVANDEQRLKLHVAAVIASNFTNYIYTLTKEYCEKENVPFNMLLPLIEETAMRLYTCNPKEMQTGPAIRKDYSTIEKHLEILSNLPELKQIYQSMSKGIINYYHFVEEEK